jgi:Uma2 family endonuclease
MAMPALQKRRWTADEVRALPDEPGKRFEVIDGELIVSPGPVLRHQRVMLVMSFRVETHLRRAPRVAYVLNGPGEVEPDPHTLVQPDIFIVGPVNGRCPATTHDLDKIFLVIEILSPSTARTDRVRKRKLYQRMGVPYWILDHEARLIERWLPGQDRPEIITDRITFTCEGLAEPLVIDLEEFFAEAIDG